MVPNLPYFMVQFDHKGEKGYGHVIEGANEPTEDDGGDEGEKGGGEFPRFVALSVFLGQLSSFKSQILRGGDHWKCAGAGA